MDHDGAILIVDDSDADREKIVDGVSKALRTNIDVLSAATYDDAIAKFNERRQDIRLIVVDQCLDDSDPDLVGTSIVDYAAGREPGISSLLLTNGLSDGVRVDAREVGVSACCSKDILDSERGVAILADLVAYWTERSKDDVLRHRESVNSAGDHLFHTAAGATLHLKEALSKSRRGLGVGSTLASQLDEIIEAVDEFASVIRDVERQRKVLSEPIKYETGRFDLFVREKCEQLASKHARVVNVESDHQVEVEFDKNRWGVVLECVIENALKYSRFHTQGKMGLPDVAVQFEKISDEDRECLLEVRVLDEGCGVEEDEKNSVFVQYKRGGNIGGNVPGLGLGLSIADSIVRSFAGIRGGGSIDLNNRADGKTGCIACVRIPCGLLGPIAAR